MYSQNKVHKNVAPSHDFPRVLVIVDLNRGNAKRSAHISNIKVACSFTVQVLDGDFNQVAPPYIEKSSLKLDLQITLHSSYAETCCEGYPTHDPTLPE